MPTHASRTPVADLVTARLRQHLTTLDNIVMALRKETPTVEEIQTEAAAAGVEHPAARTYARAIHARYDLAVQRVAAGTVEAERALNAAARLGDIARDARR